MFCYMDLTPDKGRVWRSWYLPKAPLSDLVAKKAKEGNPQERKKRIDGGSKGKNKHGGGRHIKQGYKRILYSGRLQKSFRGGNTPVVRRNVALTSCRWFTGLRVGMRRTIITREPQGRGPEVNRSVVLVLFTNSVHRMWALSLAQPTTRIDAVPSDSTSVLKWLLAWVHQQSLISLDFFKR